MSAETPGQRRVRRRAEEANLTEAQLLHREDEAFARTRMVLELDELAQRLPPGKRRKVPRGRPYGVSSLDEPYLEAIVDRMRRDGLKLSQRRLAENAGVAHSTLTDWLRNHPGAYDRLRVRYRR